MTQDNDEVTVKETQKPEPVTPVDIDASWDGKTSLDEHRQQQLATVKQPGFGNAGKAKANGE